ncbi:MAG: lamin tail domain-containing protein [Deltaproteobacteria bacterium]|nr:lamin tail domain-containing protein [Deltaproteobacteria bacterium]
MGCSNIFGVHDPVAGDGDGPPPKDGAADDAAPPIDGRPDAAPDAPATPRGSPLLLSEVALAPSFGEFIEIVNTSEETIDLSQMYVSDHGQYFRLPVAPPILDANDFIARFPDGATIGPRQVATIALGTDAQFMSVYGVPPTFSVAGGAQTMVVVAGDASPSLTNDGEVIVLFRWDSTSDLVEDADIVLAGNPSAANTLMNKGGTSQDGIDPDTIASTYRPDANTIKGQNPAPPSNTSTKRILLEGVHEIHAGTGNGIGGEDETSENTMLTWDKAPFSAPTPGVVPAALLP